MTSDWPARLDWIWPEVATRKEVEADNASMKGGGGPVIHSVTVP